MYNAFKFVFGDITINPSEYILNQISIGSQAMNDEINKAATELFGTSFDNLPQIMQLKIENVKAIVYNRIKQALTPSRTAIIYFILFLVLYQYLWR